MSKKNQVKKTPMKVTHNGTTYSCTFKNGRVTVRSSRTAKGQNLVAGVYDIATKNWWDGNYDGILPKIVKEQIQKLYSIS